MLTPGAFPIFLPVLDFQSLITEVVFLFTEKIILLDEDVELNPEVKAFSFIYMHHLPQAGYPRLVFF